MIINLNELRSNTIDLDGEREIVLKGTWIGDRLIFKNGENVTISAEGIVFINSTHKEDAIILVNPLNVSMVFIPGTIFINQSITVWGHANGLIIHGVNIHRAHTGIRINQKERYSNIMIRACRIQQCKHEGIYIGYFEEPESDIFGELKGDSLSISDNEINGCGWDGLQIGNFLNFVVRDNKIWGCGLAKEKYQDYAVTINPGSRGHFWDNQIYGPVQVLDSRVFFNKNNI